MEYNYKTKGVCSTNIKLELDGDIVKEVVFTGGCNGNLKAISTLVKGMSVSEIEEKLLGNTCDLKGTSGVVLLTNAVRVAYNSEK